MVLHMREKKERLCFGIAVIILVSCLRMNPIKTTEIGLNSDGSITDDSDSPGCSDGRKILLLSYSYHHMECPSNDQCSSLYNDTLQPADQLQLHQNCSLRDKCVGLHFVPALRRNNTNTVSIEYQCIDRKKFHNMCQNYTWLTNDSVYLTVNDRRWTFYQCRCTIRGGKFRTVLSDIRLMDQNKGKCHPAKFFVGSLDYSCDKKKKNNGTIFNKRIEEMNDLVITLYPYSRTVLPETILVIIKPEMDIEVNCTVKHPERMNPFLATTETTPKDPTLTPKGTEKCVAGNCMTQDQGQKILYFWYFFSPVFVMVFVMVLIILSGNPNILQLLTYLRQKVEGKRSFKAEQESVELQTGKLQKGNNSTDDESENKAESTGDESINVQHKTQSMLDSFVSLKERKKSYISVHVPADETINPASHVPGGPNRQNSVP